VSAMSRAAVLLLAAATAFVLAQPASAAELGLSMDVEGGTVSASVDIAGPLANPSTSAAASVDQAGPSVSAAVEVEADAAAARVEAGGRPPTASEPASPERRAGMAPGTHRKGSGHPETWLHDRPVVATASSQNADLALEAPAPLATRAAARGAPSDAGPASLPERSAGGWGASVKAAATGISGSPLALVGFLLVAISLVFRPILGAVGGPRPSLHSSVLQRPG
jgi:hypothetical protein